MIESFRDGWIPGLVVGALLVLLGVIVSGLGEWNYAATVRALSGHGGSIVTLDGENPDLGGLNGRLVLVQGRLTVDRPAQDRMFGIKVDSPRLERVVEMVQWREVPDLRGRPSYERGWNDKPIDSSRFVQPKRHQNPPFALHGASFMGGSVRVKGLLVGQPLINDLPGREPVQVDYFSVPINLAATFHLRDGMLWSSANPDSPAVGDLRIRWYKQPLNEVSVVAQVKHQVLVPSSQLPDPGFVLMMGDVGLDVMMPGRPELPSMTWLWRFVGLVLALIGAGLLLWSRQRELPWPPLALALGMLPVALVAGCCWLGAHWLGWALWWLLAALAAGFLYWQWRLHPTDGDES